MMTVGSLFSGIGGIDKGLQDAGMEIKWQCEKDPWCRKILTKHWPEVPKYEDVTTLQPEAVERVDVLAGGFPCQDLSVAGKRAGLREDTRSGLWLEFARLIRALRPRYVLVENVPGLLANHALGRVLGDLAESGYDAEWDCLSAGAFGAPHRRYRIWILAYSRSQQWNILHDKTKYSHSRERFCIHKQTGHKWNRKPGGHSMESVGWAIEPDVRGSDDGVPHRVDRLRGLGNAVVPQIVEWIGMQIMRIEKGTA